MANTYTQIYIQIVFAVQNRKTLIHSTWENELYKYITGIVQEKGQKMLAINGMPDHIHIFIGMKPTCCLSDLVREIKKASTKWIKEKGFLKFFTWQEGFGAFSYSQSHLNNVINYIRNQKRHHSKLLFEDEYKEFLCKYGVDFNDAYIFRFEE
jgi:putative transposase